MPYSTQCSVPSTGLGMQQELSGLCFDVIEPTMGVERVRKILTPPPCFPFSLTFEGKSDPCSQNY